MKKSRSLSFTPLVINQQSYYAAITFSAHAPAALAPQRRCAAEYTVPFFDGDA